MAWDPEKEGVAFTGIIAPPCGLVPDVYDRALRALLRNVKCKQPMNAFQALKAATRVQVNLTSRSLKAIAIQLVRAGLVLLLTVSARFSRTRTLVLMLLPVMEDSFAPREFFAKA